MNINNFCNPAHHLPLSRYELQRAYLGTANIVTLEGISSRDTTI